MNPYHDLGRNPFLSAAIGMNLQNQGDLKVGMVNTIDMSSAVRLRQATSGKPSYTALVVRAVALALRRHPEANRLIMPGWLGRRLIQLDAVDIAVAVERDTPGREQAACSAIIRNADAKAPVALTRELVALAGPSEPTWCAFRSILSHLPPWLAVRVMSMPGWSPAMWVRHRGGAVLVSSPAKYGVDTMVGNWLWPIGISFGLVKERPWVEAGQLVVRPTMDLTMSFNRCIIAGAPAARLMATISSLLSNAEQTFGEATPQEPVAVVPAHPVTASVSSSAA